MNEDIDDNAPSAEEILDQRLEDFWNTWWKPAQDLDTDVTSEELKAMNLPVDPVPTNYDEFMGALSNIMLLLRNELAETRNENLERWLENRSVGINPAAGEETANEQTEEMTDEQRIETLRADMDRLRNESTDLRRQLWPYLPELVQEFELDDDTPEIPEFGAEGQEEEENEIVRSVLDAFEARRRGDEEEVELEDELVDVRPPSEHQRRQQVNNQITTLEGNTERTPMEDAELNILLADRARWPHLNPNRDNENQNWRDDRPTQIRNYIQNITQRLESLGGNEGETLQQELQRAQNELQAEERYLAAVRQRNELKDVERRRQIQNRIQQLSQPAINETALERKAREEKLLCAEKQFRLATCVDEARDLKRQLNEDQSLDSDQRMPVNEREALESELRNRYDEEERLKTEIGDSERRTQILNRIQEFSQPENDETERERQARERRLLQAQKALQLAEVASEVQELKRRLREDDALSGDKRMPSNERQALESELGNRSDEEQRLKTEIGDVTQNRLARAQETIIRNLLRIEGGEEPGEIDAVIEELTPLRNYVLSARIDALNDRWGAYRRRLEDGLQPEEEIRRQLEKADKKILELQIQLRKSQLNWTTYENQEVIKQSNMIESLEEAKNNADADQKLGELKKLHEAADKQVNFLAVTLDEEVNSLNKQLEKLMYGKVKKQRKWESSSENDDPIDENHELVDEIENKLQEIDNEQKSLRQRLVDMLGQSDEEVQEFETLAPCAQQLRSDTQLLLDALRRERDALKSQLTFKDERNEMENLVERGLERGQREVRHEFLDERERLVLELEEKMSLLEDNLSNRRLELTEPLRLARENRELLSSVLDESSNKWSEAKQEVEWQEQYQDVRKSLQTSLNIIKNGLNQLDSMTMLKKPNNEHRARHQGLYDELDNMRKRINEALAKALLSSGKKSKTLLDMLRETKESIPKGSHQKWMLERQELEVLERDAHISDVHRRLEEDRQFVAGLMSKLKNVTNLDGADQKEYEDLVKALERTQAEIAEFLNGPPTTLPKEEQTTLEAKLEQTQPSLFNPKNNSWAKAVRASELKLMAEDRINKLQSEYIETAQEYLASFHDVRAEQAFQIESLQDRQRLGQIKEILNSSLPNFDKRLPKLLDEFSRQQDAARDQQAQLNYIAPMLEGTSKAGKKADDLSRLINRQREILSGPVDRIENGVKVGEVNLIGDLRSMNSESWTRAEALLEKLEQERQEKINPLLASLTLAAEQSALDRQLTDDMKHMQSLQTRLDVIQPLLNEQYENPVAVMVEQLKEICKMANADVDQGVLGELVQLRDDMARHFEQAEAFVIEKEHQTIPMRLDMERKETGKLLVRIAKIENLTGDNEQRRLELRDNLIKHQVELQRLQENLAKAKTAEASLAAHEAGEQYLAETPPRLQQVQELEHPSMRVASTTTTATPQATASETDYYSDDIWKTPSTSLTTNTPLIVPSTSTSSNRQQQSSRNDTSANEESQENSGETPKKKNKVSKVFKKIMNSTSLPWKRDKRGGPPPPSSSSDGTVYRNIGVGAGPIEQLFKDLETIQNGIRAVSTLMKRKSIVETNELLSSANSLDNSANESVTRDIQISQKLEKQFSDMGANMKQEISSEVKTSNTPTKITR